MEYIVIENKGLESERIWYAGQSEIEAFKKYKKLEGRNRSIVKGTVRRQMIMGANFIINYDVKDIIK